MNRRWIRSVVLCALVPALGSARAQPGEPVRVYTNEDIERLAPLPTQRAPLVSFDKERWEFVIQFLEREYERLGADRDQDLARALLRAEVEAAKLHRRYGPLLASGQGFPRRPFPAVRPRPRPAGARRLIAVPEGPEH